MRKLLIALAVPLSLAVSAPTAFAHSTLLDGSPGPGDSVAPGSQSVALRFTDPLLADGEATLAVLAGDEKKPLMVGAAATASDTHYVCARTEPLEAGIHTLRYSVTSEDGHTMQGNYEFEVVEGGEEVSPLLCDVDSLAAPSKAEKLENQDQGEFPAWAIWLLGGFALLSAALAAVAVVRSRRNSDDDEAPETS